MNSKDDGKVIWIHYNSMCSLFFSNISCLFLFFFKVCLFIFGHARMACTGFCALGWQAQAFSTCGEVERPSHVVHRPHCGGFSCRRAWWWYSGLVASWHVGSSHIRDWTHVPCIARQILNHWTTWEVLFLFLSVAIF